MLLSEFTPQCELRNEAHAISRSRFPVLDIHSHFGALLLGKDYESAYDTPRTVEKLKGFGVRKIVDLELCWDGELDRAMAKTRTDDGFIITFGSLDVTGLGDPGFAESVERTLRGYRERGIRGLKLWKNIGLGVKDRAGRLIRIDDPRLDAIWRTAGELDMPVLVHVADPIAFFRPVDGRNEQYETLVQNPAWSFSGLGFPSYEELMVAQERLLGRNPNTRFIIAHMGSAAEDLGYVSRSLDRFPNMYVDIAARINELGRQPYSARELFMRHQDRILFGTDFVPDEPERLYPFYFRFLETFDEHFDYCDSPVPDLGRWKICGIGLEEEVLRKVYWTNAARLLRIEDSES
jgi:predicted TIM-barrel fold metal-dependent hydrolase